MKHVHFIGIKGVGMTALATFLAGQNIKVTGSDVEASFVTESLLQKYRLVPQAGFNAKIPGKPDLVVVTNAHGGIQNNPQAKRAKKAKLPVVSFAQALGMFCQDSEVIAVAGTHGKTTTTAMIAFLLTKAGLEPSFIIGSGPVEGLPSTGHKGKGQYFVCEADEYYDMEGTEGQPKFLYLRPKIAVVTSIEMDHPDVFDTLNDVYAAFYRFICRTKKDGLILANIDYPRVKKLSQSLADRKFWTYGQNLSALWQIVDLEIKNHSQNFCLKYGREVYGPFFISMPGFGNVCNAVGAILVGRHLGVSWGQIKENLAQFRGVNRRFELVAYKKGITIFDDYAHHPTAIRQALEGIRQFYQEGKLWVVFQAHTYSRTQTLLSDFGKSFTTADEVIICEIFGSAREETRLASGEPRWKGKISGHDLALAIRQHQKNVQFLDSDFKKIATFLSSRVQPGDIVVTMGAGLVYHVGKILAELLNDNRS